MSNLSQLNDRFTIEFNIAYSMNMELIKSNFNHRIDLIVSFVTILIGTAVMSKLLPETILGLIIAILGTFQVVYSPSKKCHKSKEQHNKYRKIFLEKENLNDSELQQQLIEVEQSDDSQLFAPNVARLMAMYQLIPDLTDHEVANIEKDITTIEKIKSFIAGYYPVI